MTRRGSITTASALVATAALLMSVFGGSPASATVSLKTSAVSCSITSALPAVTSTKQLSGTGSVTCTAATATSVTVTVMVIELDGTLIDKLNGSFVTSSSKALAKGQKLSWKVSTPVSACPNADPEGKEDFYTVAAISGGGATVFERLGRLDYWSC